MISFKMSVPLTQKTGSSQPQTELKTLLKPPCHLAGRENFPEVSLGNAREACVEGLRKRNRFLCSHTGLAAPSSGSTGEAGCAHVVTAASAASGRRLLRRTVLSEAPVLSPCYHTQLGPQD